MIDLKQLQKDIYKNKLNKGFNVTDINKEFCLTYGEMAEAYEAWRKKQTDVGEEIADVVIYLLGLSEILNVDLDEDSMSEPLTDTGFMTEITKEEETEALAEAQNHMEETAKENGNLLNQAKERAKSLIEGYVKNVGEQIGKEYTVEWVEFSEK